MTDRPLKSDSGIIALLAEVLGGVLRLWRGELALAKAEAKRASRHAAIAVALLVIALMLVFLGLHFILAAAVAGLVWLGLGQAWATLLAGVIMIVLAGGMAWVALKLLARAADFPARQMNNFKRDVAALTSIGGRDET